MTKLLRSFLGQVKGQVTRGHQRSNLAYFNIFFSTNWRKACELEELPCCAKAHSIGCLQIWPKINSLASKRAKTLKIVVFYENIFSVITHYAVKTQYSFCQHHVPFVKTRRKNYDLTLKVYVENLTKVKVKAMTWSEKVVWYIIRSVSLNWTHLRCFHRFSLSL